LPELREVAAVSVPGAVPHGHATDTCLYQAACRQELFDSLVPFPRGRLLLRKIERFASRAGRHNVESAGREGVQAAHSAAGVDVAADAIEVGKQCLAIAELLRADAFGRPEVLQIRSARREWPMCHAEKARLDANRTIEGNNGAVAKVHVGRDTIGAGAQL